MPKSVSPLPGQGRVRPTRPDKCEKPPINLWALAETQEQAPPLQGGKYIIGDLGPQSSPGGWGSRQGFRSHQSHRSLRARQAEVELDGQKVHGLA